MLPHGGKFVGIERTRLFQDVYWNSGFANIVKQPSSGQLLLVRVGKAKKATERYGYAGNDQAALVGLAVMPANGVDSFTG